MKKIFVFCALTALLAGCSSEDFQQSNDSSFSRIDKVTISADPFVYKESSQTRTTLTPSSSELVFGWSQGDSIGLFPVSPTPGGQVYQILGYEESTSGVEATFDGGAWMLKRGNTYAAYYPFKGDMKLNETYTDIPVDVTGQKQKGNGNLDHFAKSDYMYCTPTAVDEETGTVNLHFHHAIAILKLDLTMPVAATWKKITIESSSTTFVTKAKMNATTGNCVTTATSSSISMDLENISTTVAGQKLTFYMFLLPTTANDLTVTAVDSDGEQYVSELRNMGSVEKGDAFWRTATLVAGDEYAGLSYVDLGTGVLWGRNNLNISGGAAEYYAWAESATKTSYTWDKYKFGTATNLSYCYPRDGYSDMYISDDDVAYRLLSPAGKWRIPTRSEVQNLIDLCDWEWTTKNGVYGYKVSHRTKPYQFIFIPVCGVWTTSKEEPDAGYYWTSDVETDDSKNWSEAYCLKIDQTTHAVSTMERCKGLSIRPIYLGQ